MPDGHSLVAPAFVANRVDYSNAVLYGTSAVIIRRLQMVLNAAARLVVGLGKYHTGSSRRPPLAACASEDTVCMFDCVRGTWPAYFSSIVCTVADNSGPPWSPLGREW